MGRMAGDEPPPYEAALARPGPAEARGEQRQIDPIDRPRAAEIRARVAALVARREAEGPRQENELPAVDPAVAVDFAHEGDGDPDAPVAERGVRDLPCGRAAALVDECESRLLDPRLDGRDVA